MFESEVLQSFHRTLRIAPRMRNQIYTQPYNKIYHQPSFLPPLLTLSFQSRMPYITPSPPMKTPFTPLSPKRTPSPTPSTTPKNPPHPTPQTMFETSQPQPSPPISSPAPFHEGHTDTHQRSIHATHYAAHHAPVTQTHHATHPSKPRKVSLSARPYHTRPDTIPIDE